MPPCPPSYNAASCYDRITLNMASIISTYGLHRNITTINATTLQHTKYVLKTQLGTSQHSYTHTPESPLYGIGQGVGNSPAVWALLSSTMFSLYSSQAHRAHFYNPSKTLHSQVDMVGFVDDTSGSINEFLDPNLHEPEYYIKLTTHDAQLWNNILCLSGGTLQAAKCLYHLLYFDFTSAGIPYIQGDPIPPLLQIKFNHATLPTPLRNLTAYTSHKTLGVHKVPAGQAMKQIDSLILKSQQYSKVPQTNYLTLMEAWIFYNTIYLRSITYPFPSITISQQNCYVIQKQIKSLLLRKCGYNRNSPTVVLRLQLPGSQGNRIALPLWGIFHLVYQSIPDITTQHRHTVTVSTDSSGMGPTCCWH